MVPQARLNPEAPEFIPNQLHKQLQSISWPSFPTFIEPDPLQLQPHCVYYPATTVPLIWDQLLLTHVSPSEGETTRFHSMADEPGTFEVQQKQQEQQKKEVIAGDSKGFVQKQVFKAIISCGKMEGRRSLQAYAWKKKGKEVGKEQSNNNNNKCGHLIKNRQYPHEHHYYRAFAMKKRSYPGVPVRPDGDESTVMIRNIPSKYTRDMLVEFLENHCMRENERNKEGDNENGEENILAFDFVYLPIDFRSGLNKGYAFVNFTKPKAAWKFLLTASHMKWDLFQSHKIREVVAARLQGKEKLERHFETMNFPCESEEVLPVCFSPPRDGVIKGNQRTMGKLVKRTQQL